MKERILSRAREAGFAEGYLHPLEDIPIWRETAQMRIEKGWKPGLAGMQQHPREAHPDMHSLFLLVLPYDLLPEPPAGHMRLHPYYVAANRAYQAAQALRETIEAGGIRARYDYAVPVRTYARACGIGSYGWNQLLIHPKYGTRFALQLLLLGEEGLSQPGSSGENCYHCGACRRACPMGALTEDGFLPQRCLRSHMMKKEGPPEEMRESLGDMLLGCDLCQKACPANKKLDTATADFDYSAFDLRGALAQRPGLRADWEPVIGANYARPRTALPYALVIAGNSGDAGLLPLVEAYLDDEDPALREPARWARERILHEGR